jgi:hypothetical protein
VPKKLAGPTADTQLVDVVHPDLGITRKVTAGRARVLEKSGWRRAETARRRASNQIPRAPRPVADESQQED